MDSYLLLVRTLDSKLTRTSLTSFQGSFASPPSLLARSRGREDEVGSSPWPGRLCSVLGKELS